MKSTLTRSIVLLFVLAISACSTSKVASDKHDDSYLWLEEVEGARALSFVKEENEKTLNVLTKDPHFKDIEKNIRKIYLADDRVAWPYQMSGKLYNFWKDKKSVRGIWRRTDLESYKKKNVKWETVLDLDELAKKENENWVWHGSSCLRPNYNRCLIHLSRGGKDATVVREFDISKKAFVEDGFYIPESKSRTDWIDENTLYVGTDSGPDSLTDSGYPRLVKLWHRGEKLQDTKTVFEGEKSDVSVNAYVEITPEKTHHFFSRAPTFFTEENFYLHEGKRLPFMMPSDASFYGLKFGYLLFELRSPLQTKTKNIKAGTIVALPLESVITQDKELSKLEIVFEPTEKKFSQGLSFTKTHLLLAVIDNIQGKVINITFNGPNQWVQKDVKLGSNGVVSILSVERESDDFLVSYMNFTTPATLYRGNANTPDKKLENIKTSPPRFNAKGIISEQKFAKSKDGTMIPYFIVHKKSLKMDGKNPTLLYGYGGFESSELPYYLTVAGKVWLEKGGVYVLANIRGGGEFGPAWHQGAVKENHQNVFDDFIGVAQDLIKNKVTTPAHLGIQGGSNGGLLTGGTFVQRPDLFSAVLCEVPLLDMLRYHKLLAGASWMGEYGNPDDPKMREVISKYSPFQNVKAGVKYPEVFFLTSTKDDRVHPGHARRMVAKMREQGHPIFYYENTEGGHGGSANIEQAILWSSLEYTYLWRKLSAH